MQYTYLREGPHDSVEETTINIPESYVQENKGKYGMSSLCNNYVRQVLHDRIHYISQKEEKMKTSKEDPIKLAIMEAVEKGLLGLTYDSADWTDSPHDFNRTQRVFSFSLGEDKYSLTLARSRKK